MMKGIVRGRGDATIRIRLRGPTGITLEIDAVIDTGFSDYLAVPADLLEKLEAPVIHEVQYRMADGSRITSPVCFVELEWHGQWQDVLAAQFSAAGLLGMLTLRGSAVHIDVVHGGAVRIDRL